MIEPTTYFALAATGVLPGFIDSIAGGGGLIMMPALLFSGLPPIQALGTNKLQSMFGTSVAAWNYHRKGLIEVRPNIGKVAAVFIGASAGVLAVQQLKPGLLAVVIPLLLPAVAAYVLVSPRMTDVYAPLRDGPTAYSQGGAEAFGVHSSRPLPLEPHR